jgi:ribosomal RNA-processing protein 1
MWHSDRPLPQQALASSLASLPLSIFPDNRIPFLRAFWQTMAREWTGIDVLRMEKFLLLVRRYVGTTFELCAQSGWESEVVKAQLAVMDEVPLNVEDMRLPNGLRFHVIDIFVDELERAGALEEGRKGVELEVLLEPLRRLAKESPTKAVRIKAKEALADERLPGNEKKEEDVEMADEGWGGFDD